jgi:hypothetical protein
MNALNAIKNYIEALETHDWSYKYSDDHRAWESGSKSRKTLLELQEQIDPNFQVWNSIAPEDWHNGKY